VNKTNTNNKEQKMIRTLPGCGHVGIIRGWWARCRPRAEEFSMSIPTLWRSEQQ
jgi:hypothetical protein